MAITSECSGDRPYTQNTVPIPDSGMFPINQDMLQNGMFYSDSFRIATYAESAETSRTAKLLAVADPSGLCTGESPAS